MSLTISIGSVDVTILEKTPKISSRINQHNACNFTVLDTTGTTIFRKGQPVVISDSVLGPLYGGFIATPKATNLYPNPHNLWTITCNGMVWLANKRTSNSLYMNQYAGTIACDQVQTVLSAEGVWGNFGLDYNHLLTDWAQTQAYGIDTFARGNQSGLGTASDTQVWAKIGSGTLSASITSHEGQLTGAANSDTLYQLGSKTVADVEALFRFTSTNFTNDVVGPALRIQDASNWYRPRLFQGNLTLVKTVAGTASTFGQVAFAATNGTYYWMRYRIVGINHYLKAWQDGTTEPLAWSVTVSDASITIAGSFGLEGWSSSAADIMNFDHLTVQQAGNTIMTTNAGDGNPGDGDLELAPAGTAVTFQQQTQSDFNSGGTGGGLTSPSSGGVTFTPTQAIQLTSSMTVPGAGNAYTYVKIWQGSYTIQAGDAFHYDVWISDICPANSQMAGIDFVCTDGTTFRDSGPIIGTDIQGIGPHPNNDLTGLATNTWYNRYFIIGSLAGKTIQYATAVFEGDKTGDYAAWFRNVYIDNSSVTKVTFFSTTATATQTSPQQMQDNGYSNTSLTVVTSYERHGYMYSPSFSLASAGIARSSYIDWLFTPPIDPKTGAASTAFAFTITASIDNFATFQPCTQNAAIPGLLPGQNLSGLSVQLVYVFDNNGNNPTLSPLLSWVKGSVQPSYVCAKSDSITTIDTQAGWNAGTLTKLVAPGGATLQLNGYARNWDDANYSSQTLYGANSPTQGILNRTFFLTTGANSDVRSRLDFVGSNEQNFTAEIDCYVTSNGNSGFVYRCTGWQNGNDTYAYSASVSTTFISLDKGTNNSSGGGSRTNIALVSLTLSSGNWHRLKIVVSGNNHQVYLDGVLYINSNDSTYPNAGYLGLRFYNSTSSTQTAQFDNFGVMAALSGTWVSPAIDIHSLGTISNAEIAIQIDPAVNLTLSTFLVEISLNNGSTWTTCVNSAASGYYYTNPVPGLAAGTNVSSMTQVLIRLTITSTTAATGATMPDLTAVTLTILGTYSATGTWISPALSLARIANAATSLVNWNAIFPNNNTSLAVATSLDNSGTYQAVSAAGNPIANINLQPLPTEDTFASNTSTSYTSTHVSGGSNASWTWDTANSRLVASGGTSGLLLSNSLTATDVDVQAVLDQADYTGLVWREVNTSNLYFLVLGDASSSFAANTMQLYKVSGGVQSQLGSNHTGFIFNRGTYHVLRVTMIGSVITVFFDGNQVFTYTDSSPLASGGVGLFNSTFSGGSAGRFYSFRVQPYGQNVSSLSVLTKLTLASTDPTATPQILDVATLVADPTISAGAFVPSAQFQDTFVSANIDTLNKQSDTWWDITQAKQFLFQAQNAVPAPWVLQQSDAFTTNILVSGHAVEYSGDLYRNRQKLKNVNATLTQPQVFAGDGTSRSWTLPYPVAANTVPAITLNGQVATVGIQGIDTGKQFYYQVGSTSITQDASQTVLLDADTLIVTSTGAYLTTITRNNTGQFPGTTSQAQYAAIDGTSGIIEAVEDLSQDAATANMTVADAQAYGDSLLQRYGVIGRTITFKTLQTGLAVGQQLSAFLPSFQMQNVQLLISQIDLTETLTSVNGVATVQYWLAVTAVEGPALDHWTKIFNGLLG